MATRKRQRIRRMSRDDVQQVIKRHLHAAQEYISTVEDDRVAMTNAYNAEKGPKTTQGRSKFKTREVRDTIMQLKPAIMRTLAGSAQPCRFHATTPEQEELIPQIEAYVRHVIEVDNPGYLELNAAVDDVLIRNTGILKVWSDDVERAFTVNLTGLAEPELLALMDDPDYNLDDATIEAELQPDGITETFDVECLYIDRSVRVRFQAVPTEEFLFQDARSHRDSPIVAHRREVSYSDLREMGYSEEQLEDVEFTLYDEDGEVHDESRTARDRYADQLDDDNDAVDIDPSQQRTTYYEAYVNIDENGDGIAELRCICAAGGEYHILDDYEVDRHPFAILSAWPVAHSPVGESIAELVADLQDLSTVLMRNTLDSLAKQIDPDIEAVDGAVEMADLMSTEVGKIIRVDKPGMLRELNYRFVGQDTLPLMDKVSQQRQQRTGITEASQGLDPKALQSSTASAVDGTIRAATAQAEFISRNIIETGMTTFYSLILREIVENQDDPRSIKIAGEWKQIDPQYWDTELTIRPAHMLGAGTQEQRAANLAGVLQNQQQLIAQGGINDNPFLTPQNLYNALIDHARESGIAAPERYYRDPSTHQPQPKEPQPNPDLIKAQADAQMTQAKIQQMQAQDQREKAKIQQDAQQAQMTDDRLREQETNKTMLEVYRIIAEHDKDYDLEALRAEAKRLEQESNLDSNERLEAARQLAQNAQQRVQQQQQQPAGGGNGPSQ